MLFARGPLIRRSVRKPTPRLMEEAFGCAWEAGLLLGEDVDRYLSHRTWDLFRLQLIEEARLQELRVGEEQVGRALVAYTSANVPRVLQTNGGVSCFILGPHNAFRIALTEIVTNEWFERFILLIIFLSSLAMVLDNPRNDGTTESQVLSYLAYGFLGVFTVELVMKVLAFGLLFHPGAYLREGWNVLDAFVVVVGIVSMALELSGSRQGLGFLAVLRTFRALRPLRLINRSRGIKMVVQTLLLSIKGIANVAMITLLIYLVFAILGVQLFSGRLYYCTDPTVFYEWDCTGWYAENRTVPVESTVNFTRPDGTNGSFTFDTGQRVVRAVQTARQWITPDLNFDNTWNSFVTLFVVATLDSWSDIMYSVIDNTGPHSGPVRNNEPWWGLFFVIFIVVGSFFLLNMFVGVIIFNFNAVKDQMDGLALMSPEQKLWIETQRMIMNYKPTVRQKPGSHPIRGWCFRVVMDPRFEVATGVAIFLNIVFIAFNHYGQSTSWDLVDEYSNFVFVAIFTLEALLKLTAVAQRYFADGWNRFDFAIILLSYVEIALGGFFTFRFGVLRVFRLFRLARMLALVKRARNVRVLIETMWYSLPSLGNIGAFLLLLFFVFAVLGVQLFALVKRRDGLDHHVNFENFQTAFLLLCQIATQDNWGTILLATSDTSDCGPETNPQGIDDCGTPAAPVYFMAFILLAGYVMVNLFVAIILDNFATTMQLEKSRLKITDLKKFADAWARFDEDASWLVETSRFPLILAQLKPPLGIERRCDRMELLRLTSRYSIPEHGGRIHFVETLVPLARKVQNVHFPEEDIRDHEASWRDQFPDIASVPLPRYRQKRCTVDQYLAATYIQAAYRRTTATRAADRAWNEKYGRLVEAYEEEATPPSERQLLVRMDALRKYRNQRTFDRQALAEAYVAREKERERAEQLNEELHVYVPGSTVQLHHRNESSGSFEAAPKPPPAPASHPMLFAVKRKSLVARDANGVYVNVGVRLRGSVAPLRSPPENALNHH